MRRVEWVIFAMVFVAHGYFLSAVGWNQNSRLDAIYSFVENHTWSIDSFLPDPQRGQNTGDWSRSGGRYYSNKAPGTHFLGIPLYFMLYHLERLFGADPRGSFFASVNVYLLNLWLSVFWTSVGAAFLFRLALGQMEIRDAVIVSLIYSFGTLIFPFDTQVWGHTTAAALLILSFQRSSVISGIAFGLAIAIEYFVATAIVALLVHHRGRVSGFFYGLLPMIALLLLYQWHCFGNPLTTPMSQMNPAMLDSERLGGMWSLPSLFSFYWVLFSWERGLFVYMPILLLVPYGLAVNGRGEKTSTFISAWICLCILFTIACFNGDGGHSSGPRYLIASLPFWCLLLPRFSDMSKNMRPVFVMLTCLSVMNMVVIAAVSSLAPSQLPNPLYGFLYRNFLSGSFPIPGSPIRLFDTPIAFNLGGLLGLKGLLSLAPLFLLEALLIEKLYRAVAVFSKQQ